MAISLIIVFQYGSMIWGIFPMEERVSWESHLLGLVAGMTWAVVYRKEGPQKGEMPWSRHVYSDESDDDDDETGLPWDQYEVEGKKKKNISLPKSDLPKWESDWTKVD